MGLVIDTPVFDANNPGSGGATPTAASGDSNIVRNGNVGSKITLFGITRKGATEGFVKIISPVLHDDVRGLQYITAETPSHFLLPEGVGEPMVPNDNLALTVSGGTAEHDQIALHMFYQDLAGVAAPLKMTTDIQGAIEHIHPVEVDITNSGTPGTWTDTVITTTQNLFKADRKYAVLGYITDTAQTVIGCKGSDTGNLRACGPGLTASDFTSDYFWRMSLRWNLPLIPVFQANNRAGFFASTIDTTASTTPKVVFIMALLAASFNL